MRRQIDVMYLETGQLSKGCKYAENDKFKLLQLPYADKSTDELSDVYFNVFLPGERFGLNSALRNSSAKSMSELIEQLRIRDLIVHLPSFKMDCKVELRETLRLIGLADGFDSMKANFAGIAKHEPYFIGDVTQKTTIEVDLPTNLPLNNFINFRLQKKELRPVPQQFWKQFGNLCTIHTNSPNSLSINHFST